MKSYNKLNKFSLIAGRAILIGTLAFPFINSNKASAEENNPVKSEESYVSRGNTGELELRGDSRFIDVFLDVNEKYRIGSKEVLKIKRQNERGYLQFSSEDKIRSIEFSQEIKFMELFSKNKKHKNLEITIIDSKGRYTDLSIASRAEIKEIELLTPYILSFSDKNREVKRSSLEKIYSIQIGENEDWDIIIGTRKGKLLETNVKKGLLIEDINGDGELDIISEGLSRVTFLRKIDNIILDINAPYYEWFPEKISRYKKKAQKE